MTVSWNVQMVISEVDAALFVQMLTDSGLHDVFKAARISISHQEGHAMIRTSGSTRSRGQMLFENQASGNAVDFRRSHKSEAGDYIAGLGVRQRPVRIVSSEVPRISLKREWSKTPEALLAYTWVPSDGTRGRVFLMGYADAKDILGEAAMQSDAFMEAGFYTTICTRNQLERMLL